LAWRIAEPRGPPTATMPTRNARPKNLNGTRPAQQAAADSPWPRSGEGLEELWLLGQPPLERLLEFVDDAVVDSEGFDRAALTSRWRAANEYYQGLERSEAGIANRGEHGELDPTLAPLAAQVAASPRFRRAFDTLPTRFGMVELDKLIIYQRHVTRNFVDARMARIGAAPDRESLFRLCLPIDEPEASVQVQKVGSRRYVFRSPSTDFRFHEPVLLRASQVNGYVPFGAVAGIVGLVVGFGSNFLNAVQVGQRMLLNNGYHRAVALRGLGITHAPCIIQTAATIDELQISVKTRVADDPEFYFESARPPLLRDFFDPRIYALLPVRKRMRQIEVSFETKDYLVAE
jgi:hypothetical protein